MLLTSIDMDEAAITVPYKPLFDEIRNNNGFVDLRGRPNLAKKIAECTNSMALRRLLMSLAAKSAKVFSIGCDLGTSVCAAEQEPHCAGGYIQVMHVKYSRRTPDDYARYADAVSEFLEPLSDGLVWMLDYELAPVKFKLDKFNAMTGSLRIWFRAKAACQEEAVRSRETLISRLGEALTNGDLVGLLELSRNKSPLLPQHQ